MLACIRTATPTKGVLPKWSHLNHKSNRSIISRRYLSTFNIKDSFPRFDKQGKFLSTPALILSAGFFVGSITVTNSKPEAKTDNEDGNKTIYESTLNLFASTQNVLMQYLNYCLSTNPTSLDNNTENKKETTLVLNWSGTHAVEVSNERYWEPETVGEVESIVKYCHDNNITLRPVGSALSPNGLAFNKDGMMNMSQLNEIIDIDVVNKTITVQAGARVSQVVDALRPYNLTLPNLASIAEQQMGGFIQVGAHGTGRCIAPVDHYVTEMKLVTPSFGTIKLTEHDVDSDEFQFAKVALGTLGVVTEIKMKCIPSHFLVEHTYVLSRIEAKKQINSLLKDHKHIRYMWIPFTDSVVVVTNNPIDTFTNDEIKSIQTAIESGKQHDKVHPLVDLLHQFNPELDCTGMGFGELRDALLALNPLDIEHVTKCNVAEAEFWKNSTGYQIRPSDELLQFDCGGQQWVWEVCFPTGTIEESNGNDMKFMDDLLNGIEQSHDGIPAHSPIEQRWSSSSSSFMSPTYDSKDKELNGLHSWVGIINYLPSDETTINPVTMDIQRREITNLFKGKYCSLLRSISYEYNATSHWAKLEIPNSMWELLDLKIFLEERFPLKKFNELRAKYDSKNILSNPLIDAIFGIPPK